MVNVWLSSAVRLGLALLDSIISIRGAVRHGGSDLLILGSLGRSRFYNCLIGSSTIAWSNARNIRSW